MLFLSKSFSVLQVSVDLLKRGIQLAQVIQRVIVRIGTSVIEEKLIKTLKAFRLAVINNNPDQMILLHPLTLSKLAFFMIDAMRETGKADLPFVIAALNRETDTYLIVGLDAMRQDSVRKK
jgi:cell division control protein 45